MLAGAALSIHIMTPTFRRFMSLLAGILSLAAFLGLTGGLVGGWAFGFAMAALVLGLAFGYHTWKLVQLSAWLESDHQARDMPDGFGTWGDLLSRLYRLLRQEHVQQQSLSDSLARFQQAAAALPDGAVMLDNENNIVWCNPAAEAHWRISLNRDRMQTITYIIRFPEFNAYLQARNFNEPLTIKYNQSLESGGSTEVTLAVQLVAFGQDQSLLLSRDVSERERLERMRSDFVANVSHELRTPLTVMAGFLETMQQPALISGERPDMLKRSIEHMAKQTTRMQRLVDDLLALSRLESEQHKLAETVIDMEALVRAAMADARVLSNNRHLINGVLQPVWVTGDRHELASAVSNLISNAVRYTPEGGTIEVLLAIHEVSGEMLLAIKDNGEGIAPEHLPRLTERFYRVDRGRSRDVGGTGLGLAIVKHVLLRHGGRLEIESSQSPDSHGSTFRIVLPAARAFREQPKPVAVAA